MFILQGKKTAPLCCSVELCLFECSGGVSSEDWEGNLRKCCFWIHFCEKMTGFCTDFP